MEKKKTKIVCTIGPASWSEETLTELAKVGMNVARLNFSHTVTEELIQTVRNVSEKVEKPIAIMADLQGPKIRLGEIEGERQITKGEILHLTTNPTSPDQLPMQFDLAPFVQPGQRIFLNDGLIELSVLSVENNVVTTEAKNNGVVSSHKGVNIPDTNVGRASFTEKDATDAEFALSHDVDYVAMSFIQTVEDLTPLKEMIAQKHARAKIVAKIEKRLATEHLEEIIQNVDAVMVARGDLAIETSASEVPIVQQKIIRLCRQYQKPVIVATQMLESMVHNPRATRAEVSDVANAVLDQVDAVMLSAETASGDYPVEAVTVMRDVILSVEENPEYIQYIKINWEQLNRENLAGSAIAASASSLAYRLNAKVLVPFTTSGKTALLVSSFRPSSPIITAVHQKDVATQLALVWGVHSVVVPIEQSTDTLVHNTVETVKSKCELDTGDQMVIVVGSTAGMSGATDTIKVVSI